MVHIKTVDLDFKQENLKKDVYEPTYLVIILQLFCSHLLFKFLFMSYGKTQRDILIPDKDMRHWTRKMSISIDNDGILIFICLYMLASS